MNTVREQIVQAVMALLQALTESPVYRREQYEDEKAFVCVWDGTQQTERNEYGKRAHTLSLAIEYVRKDTSAYGTPAQAATAMYGELVQALFDNNGQPDPSLGELVEGMDETGMTPFTPEAGMKLTGCLLQVEIRYTTRNGDPFNQ